MTKAFEPKNWSTFRFCCPHYKYMFSNMIRFEVDRHCCKCFKYKSNEYKDFVRCNWHRCPMLKEFFEYYEKQTIEFYEKYIRKKTKK